MLRSPGYSYADWYSEDWSWKAEEYTLFSRYLPFSL